MKKIFIFILFFPLFSCNDWIDVNSEESVTFRNYFNSEQDVEDIFTTILGCEKAVIAPTMMGFFDWSALHCSNAGTFGEAYRKLEPAAIWDMDKRTSWNTHYKAIYLTNFLHENQFRFKNISQERIDFWLAQADFVKALMYFRLAQDWGEAVVTPSTEDASQQAKSPINTILTEAIQAAEAALILPTFDKLTNAQGNNINSRQYASLGTVHTLLANIYAWMGGLYDKEEYWKKAEASASLVIEGKVGFYDLVSMKDLVEKTFGKSRDLTEVIFSIEKNEQDDNWYATSSLEMYYPGFALINYPYSETDPRKVDKDDIPRILLDSVYALYPDKTDLRRKEYWWNLGQAITIEGASAPYTPNHAFINKWRDKVYSVNPEITEGSKSKLIAMEGNCIYWRLADLILLRAECRAHLGMPEAASDLNRIRERAGLDTYRGFTDKKNLLREIFRERERELFGEGHRYYDIVRNKYFRDILIGNYKTLTDDEVKKGALYLPVSSDAFLNNPLMTQNIYWLWHQN